LYAIDAYFRNLEKKGRMEGREEERKEDKQADKQK
jgi:hypothetical protein